MVTSNRVIRPIRSTLGAWRASWPCQDGPFTRSGPCLITTGGGDKLYRTLILTGRIDALVGIDLCDRVNIPFFMPADPAKLSVL